MSVTPVAPGLSPFPDVELLLVTLLADLADGNIDIETPADLQDHLPFIRVTRIGGQGTRWSSAPHIDVDALVGVGNRSAGMALAQACEARLSSFPHVIPDVGVIDTVATDVSPNEVPWNDPAVLLFTSSYTVTVRR